MEAYRAIDMERFERIDYFRYFMGTGTVIDLTAKVDVTAAVEACREQSVGFQPLMLFKLAKAMNAIENFRYDMVDGAPVVWDKVVPTFSSFNQETKLFFTLYADMADDLREYDANYRRAVKEHAHARTIVPQGSVPSNAFNVSCIPWLHFDHFSSTFTPAENQIVKMVTLGKYEASGGRLLCPMTVQVSHAIADGYHVALLFEKLQEELAKR